MGSKRLKRAVTPAVVGGAALATVAAVAFTTAVPQVVSRGSVELTATITPGSATNWNADGIDKFYGIDWNKTYGDTVIAPFRLIEFWQGAENILDALDEAQSDGRPDVVVSSGRGAGNASAAITWLAHTDPDGARLNNTFWVLDNNVDRPNGGYATRYPFFALVGVNPVPVPNDLEGVKILDVGYQYAWNSSAPTYISNLPALLNAIIAYGYRYRQQDKLPIPAQILDPETGELVDGASGYYIVRTDGTVDHYDFDDPESKVTTVYVTYEAEGLPMLQPIRDFGGDFGNALADVLEPALTVLVNASYTGNNPLADPSVYTPMQLIAPPKVWATAAGQLPGALTEGWEQLREHLGGGAAQEPTTLADEGAVSSESADATESGDATESDPVSVDEDAEPVEESAEADDPGPTNSITAARHGDSTDSDDQEIDADEPNGQTLTDDEPADAATGDEQADEPADADDDTREESGTDRDEDAATDRPSDSPADDE